MAWTRPSKPFRLLVVVAVVSSCCLLYMARFQNNGRSEVLWDPGTRDETSLSAVQFFQLEETSVDNRSVHLVGRVVGQGDPENGSRHLDLQLDFDTRTLRALKSAIQRAESRAFPWKPIKSDKTDCARLFSGDKTEMERVKEVEKVPPESRLTDQNVTRLATTCSSFIRNYGFILSELTEEERSFPIAFSILTFKDAEQVLNLLRAIYRPQNVYCVHVDSKSDHSFREAITAISSCFPNVFLSSRSVNVRWGQFSVLEPELVCMQDLWNYTHWKYLINLTGQEFPLRTNYELVKILTAYNGANDLEGTVKRADNKRWQGAGLPPHGIRPVKGSVHITVNRDFVDYVLHSQVAKDFLDWCRRVNVPDETFFASLNHNPQLGIRGSYKGEPETHPTLKPFITRYKNWGIYPFAYPCEGGKRVRLICILSAGDLPFLDSRPELFANKFYADYSRFALECLSERIYNRTRDEFLGNRDFDTQFYETLPFVKNMVTVTVKNESEAVPVKS